MKDQALYHLMQLRARSLRQGAPAKAAAFLSEVSESLSIEYGKGDWTLTWRWDGRDFRLERPGSTFKFYVRGDLAQDKGARPEAGLRKTNWDNAALLWKDIFAASGVEWPFLAMGSTLAPEAEESRVARGLPWPHVAVLALLVGGIAATRADIAAGAWTGLLAFSLLALCKYQGFHGATGRVAVFEGFLLAGGAIIPAFWGIAPAQAALLGFALLLSCAAEDRGAKAWGPWCAAGLVAGSAAVAGGPAVLAPLAAWLAGVVLIRLAMPVRMSGTSAGCFCAAAIAACAAAVYFGPEFRSGALDIPPVLVYFGLASAAVSILVWAGWWLVGQMYLMTPWTSFFLIVVFILADWLLEPTGYALAGYTGVLAFVAASWARTLKSLISTRLVKKSATAAPVSDAARPLESSPASLNAPAGTTEAAPHERP